MVKTEKCGGEIKQEASTQCSGTYSTAFAFFAGLVLF
jgi:hypothetical protein